MWCTTLTKTTKSIVRVCDIYFVVGFALILFYSDLVIKCFSSSSFYL
nr:MAG TPA: hypothetical protein [Bacteriophage sp.]